MFEDLATKRVGELPLAYLDDVLREIAGGLSAFGHGALWAEWFSYLLPGLIARMEESVSFRESLISTLMNVYWTGLRGTYAEFSEDVLSTLGQSLMSPRRWNVQREIVSGPSLGAMVGRDYATEWQPCSEFSAMMFFCIKYLAPEQIAGWVASIFAIAEDIWRLQVLLWVWGAWPVLLQKVALEKTNPPIWWNESHILGPLNEVEPFLPEASRIEAIKQLKSHLTIDTLAAWEHDFGDMKMGWLTGAVFDRVYG